VGPKRDCECDHLTTRLHFAFLMVFPVACVARQVLANKLPKKRKGGPKNRKKPLSPEEPRISVNPAFAERAQVFSAGQETW